MPLFALPSPHQKCLRILPVTHREIHRSCEALKLLILHFHAEDARPQPQFHIAVNTIDRSQYHFSIVGEAVKRLIREGVTIAAREGVV
jgi:hypothetical protein